MSYSFSSSNLLPFSSPVLVFPWDMPTSWWCPISISKLGSIALGDGTPWILISELPYFCVWLYANHQSLWVTFFMPLPNLPAEMRSILGAWMSGQFWMASEFTANLLKAYCLKSPGVYLLVSVAKKWPSSEVRLLPLATHFFMGIILHHTVTNWQLSKAQTLMKCFLDVGHLVWGRLC